MGETRNWLCVPVTSALLSEMEGRDREATEAHGPDSLAYIVQTRTSALNKVEGDS